MRISLIVAMDRHALIGTKDGLPWHLPADLKRFRRLTTGKTIIMGRTTYEHIGRPLPNRFNIVLSRRQDFFAPGCVVTHSIDDALRIAQEKSPYSNADEIVMIGGADIYRQTLPLAHRLYLTIVQGDFSGQTYFPLRSGERFVGEVMHDEMIPADAKNHHAHRFVILDRREHGVGIDELLVGCLIPRVDLDQGCDLTC